MRLRDLLVRGVRALPDEEARIDAEVLLAQALGVSRAWLVAHADDAVDEVHSATFDALVARRARGEPVAYLTGTRGFHALELHVTPDVLIPRPETELLVELALARIPSGAQDLRSPDEVKRNPGQHARNSPDSAALHPGYHPAADCFRLYRLWPRRLPHMSSIEERVKKIVVEQLGVKEEDVTPNASFVDDLGADSLDTVELVMALEEEFETEIPDEEAEKITTVQQAVDYIKAHVKA